MTVPVQEVHEHPALEPEPRSTALALDRRREAASVELANRPAATLATMSDEDFEAGIQQLKLVQQRMQRLLDEVLVENVHYGNPNRAFKHPILMQAGGEELRRLLRLRVREVEKEIVATPEFCSCRVVVALYGPTGEPLATKEGVCTSVETRFVAKDKSGFIYKDAREVLHNVVAMARKRAEVLATREATGATAFLSGEEEMEKALAEAEAAADPAAQPWTREQSDRIVAELKNLGIKSREAAKAFYIEVLGAERYAAAEVFTQADAAVLLAEIERRKQHREGAAS